MATEKQGNVAFVTGASGILGPGICSVLRREGWRVACCVRSAERLGKVADVYETLSGERIDADGVFVADLLDLDRCAPVIEEARRRMGPIHLLVNNAIADDRSIPLTKVTTEYLRRMSDVDLHAPLLLAQAALPDLVATQGSIVNISSVAVKWNWPGSLMYGAMKAALEYVTSNMAVELAQQNVRVNCIRLGSVPGDAAIRQVVPKMEPELARRMVHEVSEVYERQPNFSDQPLVGRPRDVGELVAFLASSRARFITGAVVTLDGGLIPQMSAKPVRASLATFVQEWLQKNAPHMANPESPGNPTS